MKKRISILLCFALLMGSLAGCSTAHAPVPYEPVGDLAQENAPIQEEEEEEQEQELSLAFYADLPLNPYGANDYTNRMLMPLLYQGLFSVNRDNEVIPILCKSYTVSSDMLTYEFEVDPMATFSDGTPVTPEDVVASLMEAWTSRYYGSRMRYFLGMMVTDEGKVRVNLTQPYANLPLLLDIPIVKASEVEHETPLGSGPYRLGGYGTNRRLTRLQNWWCKSEDLLITAPEIPLVAAESPASIRDAFEFFGVGVVCTDPGSDRYVEYRCDYELWECETGTFVYLGVNANSPVFRNGAVRQALTKGIDRDYLVDEYYRGFAKKAELPASPNSPYYTPALAQKYAYDPAVFQAAMSAAKGETVTMLVNSSDSLRVKVAQEISRMLNAGGLIVNIVSYPSGTYQNELAAGNYDLYLGQTRLSPNMDLSPFFDKNGNLSYGNIDSAADLTLCLQALENQGGYYTLHQTVMDKGYVVPILFRSYAVYANRGLVTNLAPARDNLFCYSIGRNIKDAYVLRSE